MALRRPPKPRTFAYRWNQNRHRHKPSQGELLTPKKCRMKKIALQNGPLEASR